MRCLWAGTPRDRDVTKALFNKGKKKTLGFVFACFFHHDELYTIFLLSLLNRQRHYYS